MSEIELPAPAAVWRGDQTFHLNPAGLHMERWRDHALYSAEQVRQAVLAERERCASLVWPELPAIKLWSPEVAASMLRAEERAEQRGKGRYETLFAIASAALKECAAAIRRGSV